MARPVSIKNSLVVSTRFEEDEYRRVQEIAALESVYSGRHVSAQDLIRGAVHFVYSDNERLRESFRRSRAYLNKRFS